MTMPDTVDRWLPRLFTSLLLVAAAATQAAGEPIVIGQSVPNGPGSYRATVALSQGARAYVGFINASGGVHGHPIKLVTLDGGNDPAKHADNVRTLVREYRAIAIIGCAGDNVCAATATAAQQMHVPLIGALSGLRGMGHDRSPYLFPLRPSYAIEAAALVNQMKSLGISRAALLTDAPQNGEKETALRQAMEARGIQETTLTVSLSSPGTISKALSNIAAGDYQTVVMDIVPDMVDMLADHKAGDSPEWPRTLMSLASSSFQGIGNIFPGRVLGFTQVVPSPETDNIPLTFDLLRQADLYSSGQAIDFDGMAAYMAAKLAIEGIRRAGAHPDGDSVAAALASAPVIELGGYAVSFAQGRVSGSDHVSIGLRSRDGFFLK